MAHFKKRRKDMITSRKCCLLQSFNVHNHSCGLWYLWDTEYLFIIRQTPKLAIQICWGHYLTD